MTLNQAGFNEIIKRIQKSVVKFPDKRTGTNKQYSMEEIGTAAFSIFFTQSPSFLAYQKTMKESRGISNAETLFNIKKIPTDNHIRDILDEVMPENLYECFDTIYESFRSEAEYFEGLKSINESILLALDGVWYFSSQNIDCPKCSKIKQENGTIINYHSAITPVIVTPAIKQAIPLCPEFITPQDGNKKQDCEINASKRWVKKHLLKYIKNHNVTILGDDLYAHEPFCKLLIKNKSHFIFVCKTKSHKTLYKWVDLLEPGEHLGIKTIRKWTGKRAEIYTYKFANEVPLTETTNPLLVNWCELVITNEQGKILYKNSFITDHLITEKNVETIISAGRTRWKIENENNNTLKTKGYHLEHNFGHGHLHLSSLLAAMNILAFACHTFLECFHDKYKLLRKMLPTRETFFNDLRALTRYFCFESWDFMFEFMITGLKKRHDPKSILLLKGY